MCLTNSKWSYAQILLKMLGERLGSMPRPPISCTNYPWLLTVNSRYITPNQAPVRILRPGGRGVGVWQVVNLIGEAKAFQRGPAGLGGNADLVNVAAVVVAVNRGPAPAPRCLRTPPEQ